MTVTFSGNRYLSLPGTGDQSGTWGSLSVNPNMNALDGMFGGFATISLSSATTRLLGLPAGAATGLAPGAGPAESQNALIKFTGTLTGNAILQFTMPGFYIIHNACTVGTFSIKLSPASGTGNSIGAPPGRKAHVFFDGTSMDYVDMPEPGSALDLHQSGTSIPAWITACTVLPYLLKDGTTYSTATYPQLAAMLGSTFGGNGTVTFGVPDERSRVRLAIDTGTTARLTNAGSGIIGTSMGAAGGSEFSQSHTHTITDPGHTHTMTTCSQVSGSNGRSAASSDTPTGSNFTSNNSTTNITIAASGTGSSGNVMPAIISFLPLIKTVIMVGVVMSSLYMLPSNSFAHTIIG